MFGFILHTVRCGSTPPVWVFFLPLNVLKSRCFSLTDLTGGCSDSSYCSWWCHLFGSFFLPLNVLKGRRFSLTVPIVGSSDSSYTVLGGASCLFIFFIIFFLVPPVWFFLDLINIKKPSFQLDWPTWRMFGFFILFVVVPPVWVFFSLPLELRNRHSSARYF
jgi:hypothetical protein